MEMPSKSNFCISANGGGVGSWNGFLLLKYGWYSGSGNHGLVRGMYFFYLKYGWCSGSGNHGLVGGIIFFY